jgi:phospholipid/cholesterol/gamma-HCH transport system ATP-binding protein
MIRVENITKSFNDVEILKGISTEFEKGKTNLIIGQSGSGKTVFIKCLLGLIECDSGYIEFDNKAFNTMSIKERSILRQ